MSKAQSNSQSPNRLSRLEGKLVTSTSSLTDAGKYFITGSFAVTLPNPATLANGTVFGFSWAIGAEPTLLTVANGFLTAEGATNEIILDVRAGIELVVLNGVYQL